ncbi:MAG: glycosyltransferase [Candidatus Binatia bacterium]
MSGDRKHVTVFIHGLTAGGAQRRTLALTRAFAARGHHVDLVVVHAAGPLRNQLSHLVHLVELDPWTTHLPVLRQSRRGQVFASIPALARYLRAQHPDVMLSAASHVNLGALWARRLARVGTPLVLRVSNHLSRAAFNTRRAPRLLAPLLARHCYPWADAIIAVSNSVADDLAKVTRAPRERIVTIYSPVLTVELQRQMAAPFEHAWFAPGAPPVVLGAGRFVAQKDFPTLLKAFARVRAERPARLMILGGAKTPRRRRRLLALAQRLRMADDVALPGFIPNPLPYMARAAVFVLSSAWEGLPAVLIEAMACGCPVVSTDCPGGSAEILERGRYGPLVPVGDAPALAHAILSQLDATPDRERLRARAAMFSAPAAADRYLEVLLGVCRGGPPRIDSQPLHPLARGSTARGASPQLRA